MQPRTAIEETYRLAKTLEVAPLDLLERRQRRGREGLTSTVSGVSLRLNIRGWIFATSLHSHGIGKKDVISVPSDEFRRGWTAQPGEEKNFWLIKLGWICLKDLSGWSYKGYKKGKHWGCKVQWCVKTPGYYFALYSILYYNIYTYLFEYSLYVKGIYSCLETNTNRTSFYIINY